MLVAENLRLHNELLEARAESRRLATELTQERAISARFLRERDEGVSAMHLETTRLTAELGTERAIVARLFQDRHDLMSEQHHGRQHRVLSSYIGEYTSEFLDAKNASQRAELLGSIRATTKIIWDSGAGFCCDTKTKVIRAMMAPHGFVFREPGEGKTGWEGYAMYVPRVGAVEQLGRIVRSHRHKLGSEQWYLLELITVLLRVGEYLETNP